MFQQFVFFVQTLEKLTQVKYAKIMRFLQFS